MSVYKPKGRTTYYFDFQYRGRRFAGDTGTADRRKAEAVERDVKAEKRAEVDRAERAASLPMTWGEARDRYWSEVGTHHAPPGDKHTLWSLDWLTAQIGRETRIIDIRSSKVAELVAKRRGDGVGPATVNRSVTEALRKVLLRARDAWEEPIATIKWGLHILEEPQERVRELTAEEEQRLLAEVRPDYHPVVRFALASGVRLSGCLALRWSDIDWGNRSVRIRGKGGRDYTIPLSIEMRAILWPLQNADPDVVFCYVAQRTKAGRKRGEWYPITHNGLSSEWQRARAAAGLDDYRWHDNRHTRATRLLRKTGNLKMVQKLLGHTRIETTVRYAHVTDDDLRAALDGESNPPAVATEASTGPHAALKAGDR